MENKTKTDLTPYLVEVQGKIYLTLPGLLQEAHANGLISLTTELLTDPKDLSSPVVKATGVFKTEDGTLKTYSSFGDANANNVAKKVAGALLRMADSRAVARCLRFGIGLPFTALEELDVEYSATTPKLVSSTPKTFKTSAKPANVTQATIEKTTETVEKDSLNSAVQAVKKFSFGPRPPIQTPHNPIDVEDSSADNEEDVEFEG
jgi:hypothetical protein